MNEDEYIFDEADNIIILNDEHGNEVKFEFLDLVEYENEDFVVLLPCLEDGETDNGEVVILKAVDEGTEGEKTYVSVTDQDVLYTVFAMFKEKFKDEFNFTDDDEL